MPYAESTCRALTGQLTLASHPHRCLVVRNERIISNSVARLRPHHAAALLECAVERLLARARRGPELTVWIRAVLTHHTAYLMAAPGVLPILATLSQVTFGSKGLQILKTLPKAVG